MKNLMVEINNIINKKKLKFEYIHLIKNPPDQITYYYGYDFYD